MTKKKKKSAAPAVVRGFATSSIASKQQRLDPNEEESKKLEKPTETIKSAVEQVSQNGEAQKHESKQLDPEELEAELERNELQQYVESNGPKIVKEFQRQVSKMLTDSRVLRVQSQPLSTSSWMPTELLEEILEFARQSLSQKSSSGLPKKQPEDVWINRFWALLKVLLEMGVSKERIYRLLEEIPMQESSDNSNIWGLRQCLDILALDRELELPPYAKAIQIPKDVRETSNTELESEPERPHRLKKALASQPSSQGPTPSQSGVATPLLSAGEEDFDVSDLGSDLEPNDLIGTYISTKLRLFKLQPNLLEPSKKSKASSSRSNSIPRSNGIRKLQAKVRRIESDILFDSESAHQKWMEEKIKYLRSKPAASASLTNSPRVQAQTEITDQKMPESQSSEDNDIKESEIGGLLSGMFLDPEHQSSEVKGDTMPAEQIRIRDFGKVTGFSPRRMLEDGCRARDSSAKVFFRQISETTFACRHSVTISWTKSQEKVDEEPTDFVTLDQKPSTRDKNRVVVITVSMTTVAVPNIQQSEAFVATAAAFLLFSQAHKEEKMYLKLAPAWRDLWSELVDMRSAKRDAADREDVKFLRKLVQDRTRQEEADGFVLSDAFRNSHLQKAERDTAGSSRSFKEKQNPDIHARYLWEQRIFSPAYQYMLQFRNALPIAAFREHALKTINDNQVTILCGETGCGKSTQLPAFILEDQFLMGNNCKVLCTEPRRISAISLAHRVSQEFGEIQNEVGTATSLVGYAVRLESHIGPFSRLIYATVGVVLRILEDANGLDEYTHLVIDEVHERSIETDFLLVVLKSLLTRRPELKVVLMSATVDASRFSVYLNGAPVIDVPGRTFPVTTKFLEDAIEITKTSNRNHKKVQEEDDDLDQEMSGISSELQGYSIETRNALAEYDEYQINYDLIVRLMETIITHPDYTAFRRAILVFLPGIAEIRELNNQILSHHAFGSEVLIYPLHSTISSEDQQQAFVEPPVGMIKIVLATNIAETGVTIPDVTCVIDTGTHKEMRFDERRQLSRLVLSFVSRANAKQRRGRAGRVQEGICFHLFTKKRHDELMPNQQTPEMLRLSLQDLVMRVKICGLGNIEETLSQALDPPSSRNIRRAIDALIEVGALSPTEELTALGRQLVKLPLDANLGKLVLMSAIFGCLDAGLTIAAILSSKSPFITPFGERQRADTARMAFSRGDSDLLTAYNAYSAWRRVQDNTLNENIFVFCRKNFLSHQILSNIEDLKSQLFSSICDTGIVKSSAAAEVGRSRFSAHGYKTATRVPPDTDVNSSNDVITSTVIAWSFYPKLLMRDGKGWRNISNSQTLTLHPTSVNRTNIRPKYLSFYSIMQSGNKFYNATNALYTNIAHDVPMVLLAGDADFKMHAGVLTIDSNRLRFVLKDWQTAIAMKTLRLKIEELFERAIEGKTLTAELEWWKGIFVKMCTKSDKEH